MEETIKYKTMLAEKPNKTFVELEAEGWEQVYSFHDRFVDQWNEVADMAERIGRDGYWELALAYDTSEGARKDGIRYLYKRKKI